MRQGLHSTHTPEGAAAYHGLMNLMELMKRVKQWPRRWGTATLRSAATRPINALLGGIIAVSAGIWPLAVGAHPLASDGDHAPMMAALNTLRQRGCVGSPLPAGPVRENRVLSEVARLVAEGTSLDNALKTVDYRAIRASQISIMGQGIAVSLSRGQVGDSCVTMMYPPLAEAGFHQHGSQVWIVMAAPFVLPEAARPQDVQAQILALVNDARAQPRRCGNEPFAAVPPLRLNAMLFSTASAYARELATHSYFSHTDRDGNRVDYRVSRAGYPWRSVGENLAAGQTTPEAAVQGWLNSPGHCASIMSPVFEEMGVAMAVNAKSSKGVYWVQVFGTPR